MGRGFTGTVRAVPRKLEEKTAAELAALKQGREDKGLAKRIDALVAVVAAQVSVVGTWTPTATGFTTTGSPTYAGVYVQRADGTVEFDILIDPNGGTVASTLNVSKLTLPSTPIRKGAAIAVNDGVTNGGACLIEVGGGGLVYTPTWAASAVKARVSGRYRLS